MLTLCAARLYGSLARMYELTAGIYVAARVRQAASDAGLTLEQAASQAGISYRPLLARLNPPYHPFTLQELVRIARVTDVSLSYLAEGSEVAA